MTTPKFASLNGEIVEWDKAQVHVASAGFKFGTAVFEGLRGYWNQSNEEMYLFRMEEHMRRLEFSSAFYALQRTSDRRVYNSTNCRINQSK
ncbi:MAG: hypothetical protein CM15mP62_22090 [Rhodospirillaceae bacterium]|nr:MAG: hypothetical protein CM15mP62_22090 [Rhodospirillaceae bacterium]